MKKVCLTTLLVLMFCISASAKVPEKKPYILQKVIGLELSTPSARSLKLTVKNWKGTVKWSSKNKKIATVDKKGKVTGKKAGTTYITAKCGKYKLTTKVIVVKKARIAPGK